MAKPASGTYEPNKRVMLKVKHERDCDCVVAGFRWYKNGDHTLLGSLLMGLFDDAGALQHVGVCSSFSLEKRRELAKFLNPYRTDALVAHPWKYWAEHGNTSPAKPHSPIACQVARAAGVEARTYRGINGGLNWWWKWFLITCKTPASVISRSSADGELTKNRATVPMPSSKPFPRKN